MSKYIVIKDTYVSGTSIFAGDTFALNNRTRVEHGFVTVGKPDLANLKLAGRVVPLADADEDQIELADNRAAYLEKVFTKQDADAEAAEEAAARRAQASDEEVAPRAPRKTTSKKSAAQQTNPEGAE